MRWEGMQAALERMFGHPGPTVDQVTFQPKNLGYLGASRVCTEVVRYATPNDSGANRIKF